MRWPLAGLFLAFTLVLLAAAPAHGTVCRVTTAGNSANDGSTWAVPMDLQTALGDAACTEIWVAQGMYTPGTQASDSFTVDRQLALYGGFAGNETQREMRDALANLTILSGDIGGDDLNGDGNQINESVQDIVGTNSEHIVYVDGSSANGPIGADTIIDGFTITGGKATEAGGGLVCFAEGAGSACSATFSHLVFIGNHALLGGGAVANYAKDQGLVDPSYQHVTFANNWTDESGGAMANMTQTLNPATLDLTAGTVTASLQHVVFDNNGAADNAGALLDFCLFAPCRVDTTIEHATFSGNHAGVGASLSHGGAYGAEDAFGPGQEINPSFHDAVFLNNVASGYGGAMALQPQYDTALNAQLSDVVLRGNSSVNGGGIVIRSSNAGGVAVAIDGATFQDNSATNAGGAIAFWHNDNGPKQLTVTNATFQGNLATQNGGAIALVGAGTGTTEIRSATFRGNSAPGNGSSSGSGGAVYIASTNKQVRMRNVILWADSASNGPEVHSPAGGDVILDHAAVSGGCPANVDCIAVGTTDPLLGPLQDNGGPTWTSMPDPASLAIDAGTDTYCPDHDQRGVPRLPTGPCDLGAVEAGSLAPLSVNDGNDYSRYGQVQNYLVTLRNRTAYAHSGMTVQAPVPAALDGSTMHWVCLGAVGVTCTPAGNGALHDSGVVLPPRSSVSWLVSAKVLNSADETAGVTFTATVSGGVTAQASDSNALGLYRDGFDVAGANGTYAKVTIDPPHGSARGACTPAGVPLAMQATPERALPWALARVALGDHSRVEVQQVGSHWLRLLHTARDGSQHASNWTFADPQDGQAYLRLWPRRATLVGVASPLSVAVTATASCH